MKEIVKQFCDFVELWKNNTEATNSIQTLGNLQRSVQSEALKSLVDKPIEVTDDLVKLAEETYNQTKELRYLSYIGNVYANPMKAALEVVLNHIGEVNKMVEECDEQPEENQGEWIEWSGGKQPVHNVNVQVKLRSDNFITAPADLHNWSNRGNSSYYSDIIAYRVIKEPTHYDYGEALSKVANSMKGK